MRETAYTIILAMMAGLVTGCLDSGSGEDNAGTGADDDSPAYETPSFSDLDSLNARFAPREADYRPTKTDTIMLGGAYDTFALLPKANTAYFHDQNNTALGEANDDLSGIMEYRKKGRMADIDDDGKDETLIVVAKEGALKLVILDDAYHDFQRLDVLRLYDESELYAWFNGDPKEFSIATGDVDGDNKLEIIAAMAATSTLNRTRLKVYEGADDNFREAFSEHYETMAPYQVQVRTAQLDDDKAEEIILMASDDKAKSDSAIPGHSVHAFDDGEQANYRLLAESWESGRSQAAMDTGDIDGDGRDDAVVVSVDVANHTRHMAAYRYSDGGFTVLQEGAIRGPEYHDDQDDSRVDLVNLRGSSSPEIVVNEAVYDNLARPVGQWVHLASIPMLTRANGANKSFLNRHAFGDVDADGYFETLALERTRVGGSWDKYLAVYDFVSDGKIEEVGRRDVVGQQGVEGFGDYTLVLSGRIEADGLIARYEDRSDEVVWSDPKIIAAIAAPPADADYGMDLEASRAEFALGSSQSNEESYTIGVSASYAVGVNVEDRVFTQSELEAGVRASVSFNSEVRSGTEVTRTTRYSTHAKQDMIVATVVPYRPYEYRTADGEAVTFMEAGEPVIRMVTRDYFIDHAGFDPTEGYFVHKPGNVDTYMSTPYSESTEGVSSLVRSERTVEVPAKGGEVGNAIEISEFESRSVSWEVGLEVFSKLAAGGVFVETSMGTSGGEGMTTTYGSSTAYGMTLGGIPTDRLDQFRYSVGMIGHETEGRFEWTNPNTGETEESHQRFHLINFWVER